MAGVFKRGRPKKIRNNELIHEIPEVLGEYRIRDSQDKAVYYVGISANLRDRAYAHRSSGKFCEGRYLEYLTAKYGVSYDEVREHERRAIAKYDPPENKRGGGAGRPPVRLVYLEEASEVYVEPNKFLAFLEKIKRILKKAAMFALIAAAIGAVVWIGKDHFSFF